ncbi:MAG: hypothetical protein JXO51_10445 [Candidatus Aminicenantes bacterium]|nr:hypothetical protein [Candidatus Aminicenantes bacterium]
MRRALGLALILALGALAAVAGDFSPEKARKVDGFMARIAAPRSPSLFLKKASFSESELNSYLNLIYIRKYAPEVTLIDLRLKDENHVDGRLKFKLEGEKYALVPQFLRDAEVRFRGRFECSHYHMRFVFSELVINGSHFSPNVLDEAYGVAQFNAKVKKSIFDWFNLLPGLKSIQGSEKTIHFFY